MMCSDLNQEPLLAIQLYCARTRIEIMFDMLKNLLGAFNYHFWSKLMPRHSRKPKSNKELKQPAENELEKVQLCWDAYERFDTHPENTRCFLDALVTIDLLEKEKGLYRNLPITQTFLSVFPEASPGYHF